MEQEIENIAIQTKGEIKTLPLQSPSEWSYDALTRSLNLNENNYKLSNSNDGNNNNENKNTGANSFYKNVCHGSANSIISLLNEMEFSPMSHHSQSIESLPSDIDISSKHTPLHPYKPNDTATRNTNNVDPTNSTQMMAGLLLLCISGILDAGAIAYVNWLYGVGFTMQEIFMFQGIVQVILCFAFAIITFKLMVQHQMNPLQTMRMQPRPNVSFRSLVLPFSLEYNANYTVQHYNINSNRYGAVTDDSSNSVTNIHIRINRTSWKQLLIAMFAFGVVASASHLTYFMGYLGGLGLRFARDHYEIAPLFNSLAIGLAFVWSYMVYNTRLSSESLLYLFLMYVGMVICGYSFMEHVTNSNIKALSLMLNMSNVYLILSAFLDSVGYILIKYACSIPTFVLVFSQSVFCAISGFILSETSHDEVGSAFNEMSFSNVIEMSSVGLIGFGSTWCFIRGTQLISIGTASFIKMTLFVIFSIVIQVFSIDGKTPHFYCIFGLCLISLSIVLMLIEKFTKREWHGRNNKENFDLHN